MPCEPDVIFREELVGVPSLDLKLCFDSRLLLDFFRVRAAFSSAVSTKDPADPTLNINETIRAAGIALSSTHIFRLCITSSSL